MKFSCKTNRTEYLLLVNDIFNNCEDINNSDWVKLSIEQMYYGGTYTFSRQDSLDMFWASRFEAKLKSFSVHSYKQTHSKTYIWHI